MQIIKVALVGAVTLTTGIAVGWVLHDTNSAAASRPAMELHSAAASQTGALPTTRSIDSTELREMVRAELTAALANERGAAPTRLAQAEIAPPPPELVVKRQAAVAEIESMIKDGEWGNDQRMTFQRHIGMLAPDQAARVLHDVTVALNEGRLHVTTAGPPL